MNKSALRLSLAVLALLANAALCSAQIRFHATLIPQLTSGGTARQSESVAMSENGLLVVSYYAAPGTSDTGDSFVLDIANGTMRELGQGGKSSGPGDINSRGFVEGFSGPIPPTGIETDLQRILWSPDDYSAPHPIGAPYHPAAGPDVSDLSNNYELYTQGNTSTCLDLLTGQPVFIPSGFIAQKVNDQGDLAGFYAGGYAIYRRADDTVTMVPTPPGTVSFLTDSDSLIGINAAWDLPTSTTHYSGYTIKDGSITEFYAPADGLLSLNGITSDASTIVGFYSATNHAPVTPALFQNGQEADIANLIDGLPTGFRLFSVTGISDSLTVAADLLDPQGHFVGAYLTPEGTYDPAHIFAAQAPVAGVAADGARMYIVLIVPAFLFGIPKWRRA